MEKTARAVFEVLLIGQTGIILLLTVAKFGKAMVIDWTISKKRRLIEWLMNPLKHKT
jgi:hypothetical protein